MTKVMRRDRTEVQVSEERQTYYVLWWGVANDEGAYRGRELMTGPWDTEEAMLTWLFGYRTSGDYGRFILLWIGELPDATASEAYEVVSHNRQGAAHKKYFFEGNYSVEEA